MSQVDAHVIAPPQIEYGQGQNNLIRSQSKWDNMNRKFFETRQLTPANFKWALINANTFWRGDEVARIIFELINVSKSHNLNLGNPIYDADIDLRKDKLEQFFSPSNGYDFIVFILPDKNSTDVYSNLNFFKYRPLNLGGCVFLMKYFKHAQKITLN